MISIFLSRISFLIGSKTGFSKSKAQKNPAHWVNGTQSFPWKVMLSARFLYDDARQKRLNFYVLFYGEKRARDDHWRLTYACGNRACYGAFFLMVEMFFS